MSQDLEKLKRKRQKNVQEQNLLKENEIYSLGKWFRDHGDELPSLIHKYLSSKGIDLSGSLVLHEDMRGYEEGNSHQGLVVTEDERFLEYEIDLDLTGLEIEWEKMVDSSSKYPLSAHMPGIGKSFGLLCLSALKKLNSEGDT